MDWLKEARRVMDGKLKPLGALGRLETWAVRLAALQRTVEPRLDRARVLVFAADHGVAVEGVSAYPSAVTAQLLRLASAQAGVGIHVLARSLGVEVDFIDVGVDAELGDLPGLTHAKVRRGSRNLLHGPALTGEELDAALQVGEDAVRRAAEDGVDAIGLGEVGIANTTAASALLSALTGASPETTVGRGSGVDDAGLRRKREVVTRALERHRPDRDDPRACLAAVGGLEIAALAGAARAGARRRIAVVVDGFITTVAALVAVRQEPQVRDALFFAHVSAEAGHRVALEALDAEPLLDLGMRLGEGSGAALALQILKSAAAVMRDMERLADHVPAPNAETPG